MVNGCACRRMLDLMCYSSDISLLRLRPQCSTFSSDKGGSSDLLISVVEGHMFL